MSTPAGENVGEGLRELYQRCVSEGWPVERFDRETASLLAGIQDGKPYSAARGSIRKFRSDHFFRPERFLPHGVGTAPKDAATTPRPGLVLTLADPDAAMEGVEWLWYGRIARGKFNLLDGDGGMGKSTIAAYVMAQLSRGLPLEDNAERKALPAAASIVLTAEDSWVDTFKPRLAAANADLNLARYVSGMLRDGQRAFDPITLTEHIPQLEALIAELEAVLLVIDPIVAFMGTSRKVNTFVDADTRSVLGPLSAMAERTRCAILAIRHLNKMVSAKAIHRGGGSVGFVNAARAATITATADDGGLRLAWNKGNFTERVATLAYELVPTFLGFDARGLAIEPTHIEWKGTTTETADTLFALQNEKPEERTKREEAAEWLLGQLDGHEEGIESRWLMAEGRRAGYSERTLKRARATARIRSSPSGMAGAWLCYPPRRQITVVKLTGVMIPKEDTKRDRLAEVSLKVDRKAPE